MQDIFPPNFNNAGNNQPDENIKLISHCPVCHYHYNPVQAKVLEENDGAHLIYIKCKRCQSSTLALILANPFGISSIGLVTDLDSYEVIKLKDLDEVNENDVLDVYQFLQEDGIGEIFYN